MVVGRAIYTPPLPLNYKGRAQLLDDVWDCDFAPRTKLRRGDICECIGPVGIESETEHDTAHRYQVEYDPLIDTLSGERPCMKEYAYILRNLLTPIGDVL